MAFSFFFRDRFILEKLAELIGNQFGSGYETIKIWDAGCAFGQEPYTLAIILAEKLNPNIFKKVKILATDIDEYDEYGKTINSGVYPYTDLSRIDPAIFQKYFYQYSDNLYAINPSIKSKVEFRKHNLLSFEPIDFGFSSIVCKNVLLHFNPNDRLKVLAMFNSVLHTGGFLAMEHTQKLPEELQDKFKLFSAEANIYQKI